METDCTIPKLGRLHIENGYLATIARGKDFPNDPAVRFFWGMGTEDFETSNEDPDAILYLRAFLAVPELLDAVREFVAYERGQRGGLSGCMRAADAALAKMNAPFPWQQDAPACPVLTDSELESDQRQQDEGDIEASGERFSGYDHDGISRGNGGVV